MRSGKIKNTSVEKNRDGEKEVRILKAEISDPENIETVEFLNQSGEDTHPVKESKVFILQIGTAWKVAIAVDDGIKPTVSEGEKKLYSIKDGSISAFLHWKEDGSVVINGDDDNAVRFSKLKETIDELQSDINNLKSLFASWVPVPNDGGAALKTVLGTYFTTNLVKVIDPAKIDNIKVTSNG